MLVTQEYRDIEAALIENVILDRAEMRNHTRIVCVSSLEVWQYNHIDFVEPVKALFMEGLLQATTSPVSTAHAEALVHPGLIAHSNPK